MSITDKWKQDKVNYQLLHTSRRSPVLIHVIREISTNKVYRIEREENNMKCEKLDEHLQKQKEIAEMIEKVDHPNIVKIYRSYFENNALVIEMPFYKCDLYSMLFDETTKQMRLLPFPIIYQIGYQLASALVELRNHNNIMHRDITLKNILVEKNSPCRF